MNDPAVSSSVKIKAPDFGILFKLNSMKDGMITSKNNDIVKYISALAEKHVREQSGCFFLEGWRAVSEALAAKKLKI